MAAISHKTLLDRLNRLQTSLNDVMQEAVTETTKEFGDLNRSQLMSGIGSDGNFLRKYKSNSYAKEKNKMNSLPPFGIADLKLSGDFHSSITVNPIANKAVPTATDWKTEILIKDLKFKNALGLNDDSIRKYRAIIQPIVVRKFSEITKLEIR